MSNSRDFSSRSYTPGSSGPAKSDDTSDKQKEKKDLVGLNDKFVRLIDKVKNLEDEKTKLEKELEILKEYEVYKGKVNDIVNQEKNELKQRVENLLREQEKLNVEREKNIEEKEDTKKRFEEEQKKKDDMEKDFILAKKELDNSQLEHVQLMLDLDDLLEEMEFLRKGFDEEIKELQSQIQNKHVVLPNNNKRSLDMDDIIESAKIQYANMAIQSREEAERWYQRKMDVLVNKTEQQEEGVRDIKRMISELLRQIHWLTGELESLTRREVSLTKEINDIQKETDVNVEEAGKGIAQLEEALRQAKMDYARLIRDYQETMNLKLKLDMEIATYRKLLEGEEARYVSGGDVDAISLDLMVYSRANAMPISKNKPTNPSPYLHADLHLPSKQHPPEEQHLPLKPETPQAPDPSDVSPTALTPPRIDSPEEQPVLKKRLLIRVNVESGRVVSEKSYYAED